MQVRIRETGQVIYLHEFRELHEDTPLLVDINEEVLNAHGADLVYAGEQAIGGTVYQYSQYDGVEQIDGKWYTKYVLGPIFTDRAASENMPAATAEEQEAEYKASMDAKRADVVRTERNKKLAESDWTQVADSTANKSVWATYRQALRDVPDQSGFPWNVTWPVVH
jgi:hypothetical protein